MAHHEQYAATVALVVDATGLGAGLASLLTARLGEACVRQFIFTRPSKSRLVYQLLGLINGGRLPAPYR